MDFKEKLANSLDRYRSKKLSERRKRKLSDWGKLGGRPTKGKEKKSAAISVRFTPSETQWLKDVAAHYRISMSELIRLGALDTLPPDAERNKLLLEYRSNFNRISNYIKSNDPQLNDEIKKVVKLLENYLTTQK